MSNGVIRSFQDLEVWKKAHAFVLAVYSVTRNFPRDETCGVVSQVRRSAVSIGANIAEGGKKSPKDFVRYLEIAQGSLEETKYHLLLSKDLGYLSADDYHKFDEMSSEVGKMLFGLIRSMKERVV